VDDDALYARMWRGMLRLTVVLARHVPGARQVEDDRFVAAVVPSAPDASLVNAVVPLDHDATAAAVDELEELYAPHGIKWGVWTDPREEEAERVLAERGLVIDSTPAPMGLELDALPFDDAPRAVRADLATVGQVNDAAYGVADGVLTEHLRALPSDVAVAYRDESGASVVAACDGEDGDTAIWWVATLPEARNRGLAGGLMRRALLDARARGNTTSTLQGSALGVPVYRRLGYRTLGELHLWERRR